jgi:aryl-alcohol dehydrogenase-like predicted oxidoreductase
MPTLEKVQLPEGGATTTRIGFGCSNLLGDKTRAEGLALLHAAYDAGIRHFDVARVYNFGDAEAMVGEFAAGKRDHITISTKFGLMPNPGLAKMKGAVQVVRRLMRSSSFIRRLVRRNVSHLTQAVPLDPALGRASLEASLRALNTSYIDMYLLHEASALDCTDETLAFLTQAVAEGKIRLFGCGSNYARIAEIASTRPDFLRIAQFESSLPAPHVEALQANHLPHHRMSVTHGAVAAAQDLRATVGDAALADQWSTLAGVDLNQPSNLQGLLLRCALLENPTGMVLFRASTPQRIHETLRALEAIQLNHEQFASLRTLAVQATAPRPA